MPPLFSPLLSPLLRLLMPGLLVLGLLAGCSGGSTANSGKPTALATIFAYYDALRAIGGDKIDAQILLPPKTSPHEFQPTARNRDAAESAKLLVKNGLGIDDWADRLVGKGKPIILTIGQDPEVRKALLSTEETSLGEAGQKHEGHAETHADTQGEAHAAPPAGNPHVWLDPQVQILAAEKIRDALAQIDPANKAAFEANARTYIDQIKKLDADFAVAAKTFQHKDFVGFHSAYDYLAHRYGLRQVAAIEEVPEAGLTAAQIDKVIGIIKKDRVPAVFSESAMGGDAAKRIAQEAGARLGVLQPLETYDEPADSYVSLMRQNLEELKRTLGP